MPHFLRRLENHKVDEMPFPLVHPVLFLADDRAGLQTVRLEINPVLKRLKLVCISAWCGNSFAIGARIQEEDPCGSPMAVALRILEFAVPHDAR